MRDLKKDIYYDKDDNILNMLDGNDKIINVISLGVIRLHYKNNENYNNNHICNYNKNNISNNGLNNNSNSSFNNNFDNSSNNIANNSRYLFEK